MGTQTQTKTQTQTGTTGVTTIALLVLRTGELKMQTEQIICLNRGRSKGEDCGHEKSI